MATERREGRDYELRVRDFPVGAQMLFVAFGALVLVPLLTGLNPNVALFCAGLGTLLYQVLTKFRIPIFLGSSFAFIAPIMYCVKTYGVPATMGALAAVGVVYGLAALLIKWRGVGILSRLLPTIVTGPVIMVIGLILAPVGVYMAMGRTGDGAAVLFPQPVAMGVSLFSLAVTVLVAIYGRGMLRLVPILCGIGAGYAASLFLGLVDFGPVAAAPWFAVPSFVGPSFNLDAILVVVPVAIAPIIEHFGGVIAIGQVTGRNYLENPGVHRSLLGDGVATALAGCLGGPPLTTYAEVTGAVALTRIYNPALMTWAAVTAACLAFVGKLGALLQTIPTPVMGGIMLLLFGTIMVVGLNSLVREGADLMEPRNMVIVALIIVLGMGKMVFSLGGVHLEGIGLAGVAGVVLNFLLPQPKRQADRTP
ncbi:uracil-xanthine permease [Solidesulfovibrio carbinoliphilus subsp. oakridgensis]|uniref:Uracil-xanthine permease n=1 Tax=Solidesulfovibrio carbinoliphilus subsp. oakridgensis TaxID=694327 RepID=G7Q8M2_9BACT|nr:uracil-xanthine permease family protein [Solidesulfovibrio carbinoliphilus]EHJ49109.1 uracil-xanthine permease [Solidesulfovibrio carbinoliphilus subsp. oakridgensis]